MIVLSDDYTVFGGLDCDFIRFFITDVGRSSVSLFNINLDDDPATINHAKLYNMGWFNKFKQHKAI